nr:MAG TPA: hypothetical protein [Caudoviricetes sp.]
MKPLYYSQAQGQHRKAENMMVLKHRKISVSTF